MRRFLAIVLIAWTGMYLYVFWRLKRIPIVSRMPFLCFHSGLSLRLALGSGPTSTLVFKI